MRFRILLIIICFETLLTGCSVAENNSVSIVNWNVQTFFDAETEGTEYSDFMKAGKWSKDKYLERVKRLCNVIRELNSDIYVFEEIENSSVLYDISNQLAGDSWNVKYKWHYACFAKEEGASIGCAVLSKFPLSNMKLHSMDIRTQTENQPSVRPLLQVSADVNGTELVIFVSHWKSKLGGEEESEIWRDWQESVLGYAVLNSSSGSFVLCGDFNRDAGDFILHFDGNERSANTILRTATETGEKTVLVYNPWFDSKGEFYEETGSYYYEKNWERIDQIMSYGNVKLSSFSPRGEEPWANEAGIPQGYKINTGEGYSDHLPIMCILVLGNQE